MSRHLLALALLLVWHLPAFAVAPPRTIAAREHALPDRSLGKQPRYTGKPLYCLLVFGPEGRDRVWLVRDGDTLYADKNGNGDLTDPGEKIVARKDGDTRTFSIGTVRVGKLEHRNVTVRTSKLSAWGEEYTSHPVSKAALAKDRDVDLMNVSAEVQVPGLRGAGDEGRLMVGARFDVNGPLLFADTPASAPVVHFGGPLHLTSEAAQVRLARNVVHDLMLGFGTPGVGPGTFAGVGYEELVPKEAFVVVEAEFSPREAGNPPVRQKYDLKSRC
jgi:hypothetical protein